MCQFIESIKLNDAKVFHLEWHQKRVIETFKTFYPDSPILILNDLIQDIPTDGLYKIRIVYDDQQHSIEFKPYSPKKIQSFELIEIAFDYDFKFEDRNEINQIKEASSADEVIFTNKTNILDSSYSNLAFYDGKDWFTPSSYLLNGTTRQRLLAENKLIETPIRINDLAKYEKISFINALNDLNENILTL